MPKSLGEGAGEDREDTDVAQPAPVALHLRLRRALRRLLLSRMRLLMIGTGSVAAVCVVGSLLLDEGEVVRLTTLDGRMRQHETELWIVDLEHGSYLRASTPAASWLERIRKRPEVILSRHGVERQYHAIPVESETMRDRVNRAMAVKYGFADRLWARVGDRSHAVPIHLEPLDAAGEFVARKRRDAD